jgi:phosphatidylglycerol:prolipoprotein diacylglycerol transferase
LLLTSVLAEIPYTTFPKIDLGPFQLRTFGFMVGVGVLLGAWISAIYLERSGYARDEVYKLATRMVVWGLIGSRVTYVLSHLDDMNSPIDLIAVWEGGLQFSGGFIAAVIAVYPTVRKWPRRRTFAVLDGYAYGLTLGLAIGRVGCYSVGEHFGAASNFFLATRYEGGDVQEHFIGTVPLVEGMSFHNTSLYELIHLLVLFVVMTVFIRRRPTNVAPPGALLALFMAWYGAARFVTDFTRVNDNTVLGLTGAQYMCLLIIPLGLYLVFRSEPLIERWERKHPEAGDDGSVVVEDEDRAAGVEDDGAGGRIDVDEEAL